MNRPWTVDDATSYATLPEGPGLGVRFDIEKMKKVAAADWSARKFAFFFDKHRQFGEEEAYADVSAT